MSTANGGSDDAAMPSNVAAIGEACRGTPSASVTTQAAGRSRMARTSVTVSPPIVATSPCTVRSSIESLPATNRFQPSDSESPETSVRGAASSPPPMRRNSDSIRIDADAPRKHIIAPETTPIAAGRHAAAAEPNSETTIAKPAAVPDAAHAQPPAIDRRSVEASPSGLPAVVGFDVRRERLPRVASPRAIG